MSKSFQISLIAAFALGLFACSSNSRKPADIPAVVGFNKQLKQTCEAGGSYTKKVLAPDPETKTFSLGDTCLLKEELSYAFQFCWEDPKLAGQMAILPHGDTLVATVLPEFAEKLDLKRQAVVIDKAGKITYLSSILHSKSWLYEQTVKVTVVFDSLGLYQSHNLTIEASQPWSKQRFSGEIAGSRK